MDAFRGEGRLRFTIDICSKPLCIGDAHLSHRLCTTALQILEVGLWRAVGVAVVNLYCINVVCLSSIPVVCASLVLFCASASSLVQKKKQVSKT